MTLSERLWTFGVEIFLFMALAASAMSLGYDLGYTRGYDEGYQGASAEVASAECPEGE